MRTDWTRAVALTLSVLASTAALAQTDQQRLTDAVRLQQAVHNQDAAGNLDAAIRIYRELASSPATNRTVAAEAQYRLAMSFLQKGDASAAAEELETLARVFPDQSQTVSRMAGGSSGRGQLGYSDAFALTTAPPGPARGASPVVNSAAVAMRREIERAVSQQQGIHQTFEPGAATTINGRLTAVSWTNPVSWVTVTDGSSTWNLFIAAPNAMLRHGMNRASLKLDDSMTIRATLDRRGPVLPNGLILGRADTITRTSDGVQVFDRASLPPPEPQP